MNLIEIQKQVLANIVWIDSDNPKYEKRSREAYPYCDDCKKNDSETETMAYVYENANGHLYLHCHRCDYTGSVAQFPDAIFF